ncbi:hypothetical protein SOVF_200820 [Spinacia oleracea]|nr:hypothetical protein SOVF_200820 [Spinacia oleracea]
MLAACFDASVNEIKATQDLIKGKEIGLEELARRENQSQIQKYFNKCPPTYSQKLIDELRDRWISYVTGYHQPTNDEDDDMG